MTSLYLDVKLRQSNSSPSIQKALFTVCISDAIILFIEENRHFIKMVQNVVTFKFCRTLEQKERKRMIRIFLK